MSDTLLGAAYRDIGFFGGIIAGGFGLATVLDDVLGYYFVWGGTRCETFGGATGCYGYLPAGLMLSLLASAIIFDGVRHYAK